MFPGCLHILSIRYPLGRRQHCGQEQPPLLAEVPSVHWWGAARCGRRCFFWQQQVRLATTSAFLCEAIRSSLCDLLKKNLSVCCNVRSLLSAYKQLKTCMDWLGPTYSTDETVLAFSDLTNKTATSGGSTISTISKPQRSLITDAFDLLKNFVSHITSTGANGIKTMMSSYWFCIRSASSNV
eukprot:SAG11_NODE_330_length_10677_cov_8.535117_4_plen_182_part_00